MMPQAGAPPRGNGTPMMALVSIQALEIFYTSLLVLSSGVIFWFSGFVLWRLFKGQR